eukprot:13000312-Ditylum_brightwellii.AAC.1
MDWLYLFHLNGAVINNDAAACYDRMILHITSPTLQSCGLLEKATEYMIALTRVCGKVKAARVAELYVDDTDVATVDSTPESCSPGNIRDCLRVITKTWEQLLFGSGGLISICKMYCYLLYWKWTNGELHLASKNKLPFDLKISINRDTHLQTVKRKDPTEEICQLGILITTVDNFSAEVQCQVKHSAALAFCVCKPFASCMLHQQPMAVIPQKYRWQIMGLAP